MTTPAAETTTTLRARDWDHVRRGHDHLGGTTASRRSGDHQRGRLDHRRVFLPKCTNIPVFPQANEGAIEAAEGARLGPGGVRRPGRLR